MSDIEPGHSAENDRASSVGSGGSGCSGESDRAGAVDRITRPAQRAESARPRVQVFDRPGGFTEVYVGTEHDDFPRNQVRAVIRFHRLRGGWSMHFDDGVFRASPEAIHACLGVAIREMAAQIDGSEGAGTMGS